MIVTIYLSNKFLSDIVVKELINNKNFYNFTKKIIEDEAIFILGNKKHLGEQVSKHKKYLINTNQYKTIDLITRLYQKPNWLDFNSKKRNIPFDFSFISDQEETEKFENVDLEKKKSISFKKIKKNSEKIFKKINKIKQEIFDIELKASNEYRKYKVNKKEINKFTDKLLKSMHASKKIIIWDQYIPSSLAYIQNRKNYEPRIMLGKFHNDYCNTLKFLEREIFSKTPSENFCEIITINKLQEDKNYEKFSKKFEKIAQNYLNSLKLTKSELIIKNYGSDIWTDLHSRLIIFKDDFNQLVSYFVVEPGVDFIKLENVDHYCKKGKDGKYQRVNKFKYRFTPGTKDNYNSKISADLKKINKQSGFQLQNIA